MTTILNTPEAWPSILLARAKASIDAAEGRGPATPELAGDPAAVLDAAVAGGAFAGLRKAVHELGATGTVATIAASGLRGRGGAGYPTGEKWRACAEADAPRRYVVANGYGADPAAQTDRLLLESDPWAVVEGVAIAAFAVAAEDAFIAVRAEAIEAIRRLEAVIAAAEEANLIGQWMLGSNRSLTINVRPVQGAYMLGEETVLLKAIAGRRGQPEQRPPHPTESGLFGMPTVVQNVQTLALVPWIISHGPEAFAAIGSKSSPGTILVAVRGPKGAGVAEVPLGTPLGEIVGLVGKPGALKAVLVGGPAGGLLPPSLVDTPYDFDALRAVGAHVGSGSIVAADERACVVDLARLLTRFCADEACGKTIPCRIGTRRISEIGDRIASGVPKPTDLQLLSDLSADVVASALCDHERLATLPYMSGMRYFRSELDEHILRSTCPAGVCRPIAVAAAAGAAGPAQ
ncbi:MAG TPA: NADH-ubiquinone oxidoreductase-F iron-sulfur binding region domain-containing protein [Candidatus Limnocylindrales bacterium]